MNAKSKDFLLKYLINPAPVNQEVSGQKLWLEYIKPFTDTYISDVHGSVAAVINPEAEYKVVIEAHADEIAWSVLYITDEGLIYVQRNGGSDPAIAPSKRVYIHTEKGMIPAVFGWPAIHVRDKANDNKPELNTIFLDCGAASKQEVHDMGIHVGCLITFQDEPIELNGGRCLVGRALDNRIGGFMIAEVARKLYENKNKLDYGLYIVNAVKEEVGLRGAEMMAARIQPDVAIITDVTHDTTTPMYDKTKNGDLRCGNGPVIVHAPSVHNKLIKIITETAEKNKIPFQRASAGRASGTDTDAFSYSGVGTAAALISLPLRYMHTTVETVHYGDVEKVIDLIYHTLIELKAGTSFNYI
ncbi:MAG: M20/M25/M40 family metallo-hydrolase [Bernardetiaceae bacterium]|nr:M20/M25/M40 family metallo-hydrolase [Bernardetiaceae bacterium]